MKADFSRFKRKIYLQMILILVVTALVGGFLTSFAVDGVLQAPFADAFVSFARRVLGLEEDQAIYWYFQIFQNFKEYWLAAGFLILLLIFCRLIISRFTRAFDQIRNGIHELTQESDRPIVLSKDLKALEDDLNTTRLTLRRRKANMLESERRKNDLVMYLAHDLKTPLTSVIGYLSLLENNPGMPAQKRDKYVKIALDKAGRLEHLVNEFFEITRFDLDAVSLHKVPINLSMMLDQLADEFYPSLAERNLTCEVYCPEELYVPGDPDKLARVFNNLLRNASAYSEPNTALQIFAQNSGNGQVLVRVRNCGKQIPPEKLSLIFDKFYRLEENRGSNSGGAGLGLAIAKRITEAHGGTIRAYSSSEYTEFVVALPVS